MPILGTQKRPLRVAIVGAGPAGFYTAEVLFKHTLNIKVDMFEKLPAPFGLVRYGVAPDHEKIKNVIKIYEKTASHPQFSFFGHVNVGGDMTIFELRKFYDAIIFCYGAELDKHLGIEGETLKGSHTATEFVGWYNGHPRFRDQVFDLKYPVAVVMGQGNVAMDVARILCSTTDELSKTDICQHALDVLAGSKIKEVHVFGRRGPVQAAFTPLEIREMGQLVDTYPVVDPLDLELNQESVVELEGPAPYKSPEGGSAGPAAAVKKKNLEILRSFIGVQPNQRKRKFVLHFKRSPVQIIGHDRVQKVKFEINELTGAPYQQTVQGTGCFEEIECGNFFSSIGYVGNPLPGLPFSQVQGIVPNAHGRVLQGDKAMPSMYVSGWIQHGASGVIGSNKVRAEETVRSLMEDLSRLSPCEIPSSTEVAKLLKSRQVEVITFIDWKKIDAYEIMIGLKKGKPREKVTRVSQMISIARQKPSQPPVLS